MRAQSTVCPWFSKTMMVIGSFMVMVPRKYKRSQGLGLERVHLSPANDFNPAFLMARLLKSAVKKKVAFGDRGVRITS